MSNRPMPRPLFVILFPLMAIAVVLSVVAEELWNTVIQIRLELRVEFASLRRIWKGLP